MPRSDVNALTLLAVLIATGLGGIVGPERSLFAQLLVSVVLLIILFSFDREGYRTSWQSLGFAAVAGVLVTKIAGAGLVLAGIMSGESGWTFYTPNSTTQSPPASSSFPILPTGWIGVSLMLWAIDMSRMSRRAATQPYAGAQVATTAPQAPVVQAPVAVPKPVTEEPVRVQAFSAPPPPSAPVRPSSVTSIFSQPPPPTPASPPPSASTSGISVETAAAQTIVSEPVPAPAPIAAPIPPTPVPQTVAVPRGSGKPATIYLNLVGEGLAVLRAVQAEHIGKDYYLIVEQMPPGENWEFQPGQVVRCQKRNLSSGKALVAVEEAPRAS